MSVIGIIILVILPLFMWRSHYGQKIVLKSIHFSLILFQSLVKRLYLYPLSNDIFKICKAMVIVEWIREHEVLFMRIGSGTVLFLIVFLCLLRV